MLRYFLFGLLILLFSSCLNEPDCVINASNEVKIAFKKLTSDSARTIILDSILVSGTDSVFNKRDTVSSIVLPVDPTALTTTYQFYYDSKMNTLVLSYKRQTRMISPACGAFNYFFSLGIQISTFADAIVINPELSTSSATNVTIKP